MNFTREPIIETIITPREGYRLVVKNTKGTNQEEYSVDALEVVSFGSAIFYRSLEKPKPFLVPVADFEIVEVKETRVILKNVNLDRAIKIAGGREPAKPQVSAPVEEPQAATEATDKKRERRNRRRRRDRGEAREKTEESSEELTHKPADDMQEGGGERDEIQVSSPTFTTLFPPPPTLISQTLARYKDQSLSEGNVPAHPVEVKEEKQTASSVEVEAETKETEKKEEHHSEIIPFPEQP